MNKLTDTDRINWLEQNPRLAEIIIEGEVKDCYYYAVAGVAGVPLRTIIDAAINNEKGVT